MKIREQGIDMSPCAGATYLLGIVAIHFLFEVAGRVAHDDDPILHDVRQVDIVVARDHAATRAAHFLS